MQDIDKPLIGGFYDAEKTDKTEARQQAYKKVRGWLDVLGCELSPSDGLIRAVAEQRLEFELDQTNSKSGSFVYMLISPITQQNGEVIQTLRIREPTGSDLHWASKEKKSSEVAMQNKLISLVSGIPLPYAEKIVQRDIMILGELLSFFS